MVTRVYYTMIQKTWHPRSHHFPATRWVALSVFTRANSFGKWENTVLIPAKIFGWKPHEAVVKDMPLPSICNLNIPPPPGGIPRAFDTLPSPGSRAFDFKVGNLTPSRGRWGIARGEVFSRKAHVFLFLIALSCHCWHCWSRYSVLWGIALGR